MFKSNFFRAKAAGRTILLANVTTAMAILWAVPARADDAKIRIMTQNVYQGTNFDELLSATTPDEFVAAVTTTYQNILATKPDERAASLANEIARESPDIVSLQEVATLLTGPPQASTVNFDYLQLLKNNLSALGQSYTVVATLPELDAEAPSTLGFDVRLQRGDVVLMRSSDIASVGNVQVQQYSDNPGIVTPVGPI